MPHTLHNVHYRRTRLHESSGEPRAAGRDVTARLRKVMLATVLQQVGAAIDAIGGSFTMAYNTVAVTAARTTSA